MQTATQRVAEFVANFKLEDAPDEVVEKAKVTLLHDLGVAMAGHELADVAYSLAKDIGACADVGARLLVDGTPVTVEQAALATGALMHARTQDDTQLSVLTHLGCTTLPALLALSDRDDRSGRDFLTAMIAGYETVSAIASNHAADSTARGLRASSIYGSFGAAAACSKLLSLSAEQTAAALGLAASFGGGTNQTWVAGTQEWQYQVGMASRSGLIAALLAARDVSSAPDALEGVMGHYRSFAGDADGAELVGSSLGSQWRMLEVTYKPFPICAINQVPVTVLIELLTRHDIREEDVESVSLTLSTNDAAYPGTDTHGPFQGVGGSLMSAPYCLAVAIRKRNVGLADLHDFDDASLMALVRRIEVLGDKNVPANSCRINIRTRDGEFSDEYMATPATFNWDRYETIERLATIVNDMPFDRNRLDNLADICLDLDNRSVRELVSATLR